MLHQISRVQDCRIVAKDGEIGRVADLYFDSQWIIRHLVVRTGGWMSGREMLVSPCAVKFVDPDARAVIVALTREDCDALARVKGEGRGGIETCSGSEARVGSESGLRSSSEVTGYRMHTADGYLGHLEDLLFDEQTWAIECLIIDTRDGLRGRKVLLSPREIRSVNGADGELVATGTKDDLKRAPEFVSAHLQAGRYDWMADRSAQAR